MRPAGQNSINMAKTKSNQTANGIIDNIIGLSAKQSEAITHHLAKHDEKLSSVIKQVGAFPKISTNEKSVFGACVRSIIYQQLNGRAAQTIYDRFKGNFNTKHCPSPASIADCADEDLKKCGISKPKLNAIRDLCRHQMEGILPADKEYRKMTDDEIIAHLTQVKGVGIWTAQMILMFHLGRPDVLPSSDFGIRKGFQTVFSPRAQSITPENIEKRARLWIPYRSVASWYLWRILDA